MPDRIADKHDYDDEEILEYNMNLFVEAIDIIYVANIIVSLKNDINIK
jgi:hypothetical protein